MTTFKLNNGHEIPAVGFGVFQIPNNGPTYEATLQALKAGYRHIDTAAGYMNESDVGKAVKDSGIPREEIYITSKLWLQDHGYENAKIGLQNSLNALGVDYIDLYLIHQPYGDVAGSWKALEEAVEEGKIKSIGLSNNTVKFLTENLKNCKILPAVNQVECNPYFQQVELRQLMDKYNIRLEAWFPLGHGNKELLTDPTLVSLAEKYGKDTGQIILRWHYQEGFVSLPKSTNPVHIQGNINIFDFELTNEEMDEIRRLDRNMRTHNPEDKANETRLMGLKIHD